MTVILDSTTKDKILKIDNVKIAPVTKASNVLLDDGNSILGGLISNDNIDSGTLSIINGKLYANFRIVTSAEMKAIEEAGERLPNVIYFISDDDQDIPEIIQNFGQAENGNLTFNDVEYLPTTGGTITGRLNLNSNIYMNNDSGIVTTKSDGNTTRLLWMSNSDTVYLGSKDCQANINSSGTPYVMMSSGNYPIYHEGNKQPVQTHINMCPPVENFIARDSSFSITNNNGYINIKRVGGTGHHAYLPLTKPLINGETYTFEAKIRCNSSPENIIFIAYNISSKLSTSTGYFCDCGITESDTFKIYTNKFVVNDDETDSVMLTTTNFSAVDVAIDIEYINILNGDNEIVSRYIPPLDLAYNPYNKPTANDIRANTTLFAGKLAAGEITTSSDTSTIAMDSANINKNCFTGDYFTSPEDGYYLFTGFYNITDVATEGSCRLWIQVETPSGVYVDGAAAINMWLYTDKKNNYSFFRYLYVAKGNRVKFYHNVDNGATYAFAKSDLMIIKLN